MTLAVLSALAPTEVTLLKPKIRHVPFNSRYKDLYFYILSTANKTYSFWLLLFNGLIVARVATGGLYLFPDGQEFEIPDFPIWLVDSGFPEVQMHLLDSFKHGTMTFYTRLFGPSQIWVEPRWLACFGLASNLRCIKLSGSTLKEAPGKVSAEGEPSRVRGKPGLDRWCVYDANQSQMGGRPASARVCGCGRWR